MLNRLFLIDGLFRAMDYIMFMFFVCRLFAFWHAFRNRGTQRLLLDQFYESSDYYVDNNVIIVDKSVCESVKEWVIFGWLWVSPVRKRGASFVSYSFSGKSTSTSSLMHLFCFFFTLFGLMLLLSRRRAQGLTSGCQITSKPPD